jgi:hypothetical protein
MHSRESTGHRFHLVQNISSTVSTRLVTDLSSKNRSSARLESNASLKGVGAIGDNRGTININFGASKEGGSQPPLAHNVALKHLADRDEQEVLIRRHLTNHRLSRRPIVFFVHGGASQCLDAFIDRLGRETIRRHLRQINNTDQIEWKMVFWPQGGRHNASDRERIAVYKNSLTAELEVDPDANIAAIGERIALYRRPLMLSSVHAEIAEEDDEVIRAFLEMWSSLADLRTELSLIIFVAIICAEPQHGFMSRFRPKPKLSALAQNLEKFESYSPGHLKVVVLPELGNVTVREVEHWVRNVLRPADIEDALRRAREAFGDKRASLPMALLQRPLEALVPTDRERLRTQ